MTDAITVSAISGVVALVVALGAPELSNRRNDRDRKREEREQLTRKLVSDQASYCIQIIREVRYAIRQASDLVSAAENGAPQRSSAYPSHMLRENVDGLEVQLTQQFEAFRQILHDLDELFEESAAEYGRLFKQRRGERNFARLHSLIGDMRVLRNRLELEYKSGLQLLKTQGGLED